MPIVISVENLSKAYRLGQIGTGTLTNDLRVWWAKKRGKPNPLLKIGQQDHGNRDGETIWALKDINFKVEQGEVLGIIGRNGAGKSTLLKILAQVTAPTEGVVRYKGRIASLLEVGTGFHPDLTGRDNIYLNGAILGMSTVEVRRKFDEIVAFAEVEKFVDTPVKRYSSGMYVRLAFAVAANLESEILLVDEVLAVGDAEFQKKCLGRMGEVASKEGRTVLFVSHNMGSINQLCANSLLLSKGVIKSRGKTDDIVAIYLQSNTASTNILPQIETSEIKIINFIVFQKDISDKNLFVTNKSVFIEYEYEIKEEIFGLRIGFDVASREGVLIFRTFDDDLCGNLLKKPGIYRATCLIPPFYFNSTDYFINPKLTIHRTKWIYSGDFGIRISMHNQNGVNSRYDDSRPGFLMPGLEWQTKKIDERW